MSNQTVAESFEFEALDWEELEERRQELKELIAGLKKRVAEDFGYINPMLLAFGRQRLGGQCQPSKQMKLAWQQNPPDLLGIRDRKASWFYQQLHGQTNGRGWQVTVNLVVKDFQPERFIVVSKGFVEFMTPGWRVEGAATQQGLYDALNRIGIG